MTTAQQFWEWVGQHLWTIILVGSFFIQIAPIKINPWSTVIKWVGKLIMNDACGKMDSLITKVDKIESDVTSNEKDRIRWEILDFANSCRNNRKHTRDEFQHIVALHDKYQKLLEITHDTNGVFEVEYNYIQGLYAERMEKNDFL